MSYANPFWLAMAAKANQSADYIATTKDAERMYYGRSPWADTVNGAIIDHMNGSRGVLDAQRDYQVGMATASTTENKALQHAAGQQDRELAAAALQLAQSRSIYETNWANLQLDSSNVKFEASTLPITGASDGTISLNKNAGTTFVPGWLSVPSQSSSYSYYSSYSASSPSTSTGFNASDLDHYFNNGTMPDMPGSDPVSSGKVSRDDSKFTQTLGSPTPENKNQTKQNPETNTDEVKDDNPDHNPPGTSIPLNIIPLGELYTDDVKSAALPVKPTQPGGLNASLPNGLLPPEQILPPALLGRDPSQDIKLAPINFGQRPLLSAMDANSAVDAVVIIVVVDDSIEANSIPLANAELELTEIEAKAIEAEAEAVADELRQAAAEVTMEELFKVTLPPGETATYDWKAVQEAFIERYGENGIAALMLLHEQGWQIKEVDYWNGTYSWDAWPDQQTNTIHINRGDWFNLTGRSNWNAAGQLYDSVVQAISERERAVRSVKQWELTEKEYPFLTTWVLRLADDAMLNVNTSTLEWLEGESMDGKVLTPEEMSARGWESVTAFGLLVLTGAGMKLPGTAATAESLAGKSLGYRILHAPIGSSVTASARATATRLGGAVLSNPRVAALVARLEALKARIAAKAVEGETTRTALELVESELTTQRFLTQNGVTAAEQTQLRLLLQRLWRRGGLQALDSTAGFAGIEKSTGRLVFRFGGRQFLYTVRGRIRHELTHLLQQVRDPSLMAREAHFIGPRLRFGDVFNIERAAYLSQHGGNAFGRMVAIPEAALNAGMNTNRYTTIVIVFGGIGTVYYVVLQ